MQALLLCVFFLRFYLFIHERHKEKDIGRGRCRLLTGSPMWDSILELQDHALSRRQTLNSWVTQASHTSVFSIAVEYTYQNSQLPETQVGIVTFYLSDPKIVYKLICCIGIIIKSILFHSYSNGIWLINNMVTLPKMKFISLAFSHYCQSLLQRLLVRLLILSQARPQNLIFTAYVIILTDLCSTFFLKPFLLADLLTEAKDSQVIKHPMRKQKLPFKQ